MKNVSFALAAMLTGCLLTGVVMSLPKGLRGDLFAEQLDQSAAAQQNLATATDISSAFRNVAEALRPSVVSISTTVNVPRRRLRGPQLRGIPDWMLDQLLEQVPAEPQQSGMGSGVIVRSDGYILTNNHVVRNADELNVELYDGRTVNGTIIGTDPATDLAVVKIELTGLQTAPVGSSEAIRVGDWVLAIGSPFGLDQTVTAGIISGKNRVPNIVAEGRHGFEDFLQTDAAINPGNSGGPLVNLRGELVGINTAILSRSGASAGIGFAIPTSLARPVLESIIENGEVRRGFLGAKVADVNQATQDRFDLKVSKGALISSVTEDQPADRAGLSPGDVVTQADDRRITSGTQLRNFVAGRPPGTTVTMQVDRDGQSLQIPVKLGERTDEAMALFDAGELFGAEMIPVTPESAAKYGYEGLEDGLLVIGVKDGTLAAQGGLQVGDIIEKAAGVGIRSVDQLSEIFDAAQRERMNLRLVVRRGNRRFMLLFEQ